MAYPSSRGWKIEQLKKKGITKFDGKQVVKMGKQELNTLYNKEGK